MRCPYCDSISVRVKDSRPSEENTIVRYRVCENCGCKFQSIERIYAIKISGEKEYERVKGNGKQDER